MGTAALQNSLATPPEAEYMSTLRISDSTQHKYVPVSQDTYPQTISTQSPQPGRPRKMCRVNAVAPPHDSSEQQLRLPEMELPGPVWGHRRLPQPVL